MIHQGTPAAGHFTGMATRSLHARGAGAPGIPSGWPKSPDAVRESCAAARPGLNEFRSPRRSLGSPRKV
ncbi:MAG: hypothetical protein ABSG56_06970 [Bryobacteraceae bacterium]